jgi:hypothetical protein
MDNEVSPTWRLAWGLWWRMLLISLGISVVIGAIMFILFKLDVLNMACILEKLRGCLPGV